MFKILSKLISYAGIIIAILLTAGEDELKVPENYKEMVKAGGIVENRYLENGEYEVSYIEETVDERFKKYEIFYPSELEKTEKTYPVIVVANGTATAASTYTPLFEHFASWGFVVIGNEDEGSYSGESSDKCLEYLMNKNNDVNSVFYNKLDFEKLGITGHSQGGAAIINAMTKQPHGDMYKAAAALSPAGKGLSDRFGWSYDESLISVPIMIAAGTSGDFEIQTVLPFEEMEMLYSNIKSPKLMLRKTGMTHGETLYSISGYVTAWFRWQLCGDMEAAKAFTGSNPEILTNGLYQDQQIDLE